MSTKIDIPDILPLIREKLNAGGTVTLTVTGDSMFPFLRSGRDQVTVAPMQRAPKRNDVLLYQRRNGVLVLHRVIGVHRDGSFVCCGDRQSAAEPGLRPEQILGIAVSFRRKGRHFGADALGYRMASTLWRRLRLFRRLIFAVGGWLLRVFRKQREKK